MFKFFKKKIQHYCWLESTFSVADSTSKSVGLDVAYPGVKTLNAANGERKGTILSSEFKSCMILI